MGVTGQALRAARHFELIVKPRIEPTPGAGVRRQALQVVQHHVAGSGFRQHAVEPIEIIFAGGRMP
jgi:hypothetical protein